MTTKPICTLLFSIFVLLNSLSSANAQSSSNNSSGRNSSGNSASTSDWKSMSEDSLIKAASTQHPGSLYILAGKLFQSGKKDDAVFWFYAGQLRYRFHLSASPGLNPSGDPALFASLSESIGRPINEYAFGDLPALTTTIDRVLEWDEKTPNGFTSKTTHASTLKAIREGLVKMKEQIKSSAEEIKSKRKANGLPNRT